MHKYNNRHYARRGFTLVELVITIAILAVLMGISVPVYAALQENSTKKVCTETRQSLVNELVSRRLLNNEAVMTSFHLLYPAVYTCPESGTFDLPNYKEDESSFTVICTAHGSSEGSLGDKTNGSNAEVDTELPSVSVVTPEAPKPEPEPEPGDPDDGDLTGTDDLIIAIGNALSYLNVQNSTKYNDKIDTPFFQNRPFIKLTELSVSVLKKDFNYSGSFEKLVRDPQIGKYTGNAPNSILGNSTTIFLNSNKLSVRCLVYNDKGSSFFGKPRVFYFADGSKYSIQTGFIFDDDYWATHQAKAASKGTLIPNNEYFSK